MELHNVELPTAVSRTNINYQSPRKQRKQLYLILVKGRVNSAEFFYALYRREISFLSTQCEQNLASFKHSRDPLKTFLKEALSQETYCLAT